MPHTTVTTYDRLYIDGGWHELSEPGRTIEVRNPASERTIALIPEGTAADIDAAVNAARTAFPAWSATAVETRADFIRRIGEVLQRRRAEIAALVSAEEGMPLVDSDGLQAGLPIVTFADTARNVLDFAFEERLDNSIVVREPIGVVGCITPWNFPLHQIAAKVAPALAVGCTVVLKPSEVAPLNAFLLAEVVDEVGLPAGVFNLVTGYGDEVGQRLSAHPDVDMVSFTGSTRAGRQVIVASASTIKRVALELGGKSASVLLDDADVPSAVEGSMSSTFLNGGQSCSALTRLIVPRSLLGDVEATALAVAHRYVPGDPAAPGTRLGPMVSKEQQQRVRAFIDRAADSGARLLTGGSEQPAETPEGYYVRPTIFSDVDPSTELAQEEVFGPVLAIIAYEDGDVDAAVDIANDTPYGLAGAVWSASQERAIEVGRRLRTGQVQINSGAYNPRAPFGGFKQSGIGREFGPHALAEFTELKAMQLAE